MPTSAKDRALGAAIDIGTTTVVVLLVDLATGEVVGEASALKREFKAHFRNISRVMDCVGCDKCKLWGKLQFLGVATALKSTCGPSHSGLCHPPPPTPSHRSCGRPQSAQSQTD